MAGNPLRGRRRQPRKVGQQRTKFCLNLLPEYLAELDRLCEKHNATRSAYIEHLMRKSVKKREEKENARGD